MSSEREPWTPARPTAGRTADSRRTDDSRSAGDGRSADDTRSTDDIRSAGDNFSTGHNRSADHPAPAVEPQGARSSRPGASRSRTRPNGRRRRASESGSRVLHGPAALRGFVERAPGRSLALAFAIVTAAATATALVGVVTSPTYGALTPAGGVGYPDIRVTPTASGWSTNVAEIVAPGARPGCVTVTSSSVGAHLELVSGTVAVAPSTAATAVCSSISPRLAMIDTRTGRTRWVRSAATVAGAPVTASTWTAAAKGRIVVSTNGPDGARLVTLDGRDGSVVSRASVGVTVDPTDVAVSGSLVLVTRPTAEVTSSAYTLLRDDRLGTPLWSDTLAATTPPVLFGDEAVATTSTGTVRVSGRTGSVTPFGTDIRRYSSVQIVDDRLVAIVPPEGVGLSGTVDAYDRAGHHRWSHLVPTDTVGLGVSRGCVLTSTSTGLLTCLDAPTGRTRWTAVQPGSLLPTVPGQTSDAVDLESTAADGTASVIVLDGSSGSELFDTTLPPDSVFIASGRATAYAVARPSDAQGSRSAALGTTVTAAVDLGTGRRLWQRSGEDVRAWSGRLVAVTDNGRVTELVAPPPPRPLGGTFSGLVRGMLGG